jgi:hypothetical protein
MIKGKLSNKIVLTTLVVSLVSIIVSCQKEKSTPADMLSGATVNTLYLKGYSFKEPIFIKVGSQNIEVAQCDANRFVDISSEQSAIRIPFAPGENEIDLKFCTAAGKVKYTHKFNNTSSGRVKFMHVSDSIYLNPVIPQPTAGKMGIMLRYDSAELPNWKENVDIALYYVSKTGTPTTRLFKTITNVPRKGFTEMIELEAPTSTYGPEYALVVKKAGTSTVLPLPNFIDSKAKFFYNPGQTSILSISDSFEIMQYNITQLENYVR